jgi:hypothetical protein
MAPDETNQPTKTNPTAHLTAISTSTQKECSSRRGQYSSSNVVVVALRHLCDRPLLLLLVAVAGAAASAAASAATCLAL